ncbi:MAG: hypothetical protein Q9227_008595 [Pyrenula ochraceoflavens]
MNDADIDSDTSSTKSFSGIASIGESFVPSQHHKQAAITTLDLDGLLHPPIQLKEDLKEGCGGQLWPAGMVLAKYLLRYHRYDLIAKTMHVFVDPDFLELGAGGGLVGLAVARGCNLNRKTQITDQLPMLELMQSNIRENGLEEKVTAHIFDWGSAMSSELQNSFTSSNGRPDIILAADCVYFEPAFPLLKRTLEDLVSDKTVCYFCFKKRRKADWRFVKSLGKTLTVREVMEDEEKESSAKEGIHLYEITAKRRKG